MATANCRVKNTLACARAVPVVRVVPACVARVVPAVKVDRDAVVVLAVLVVKVAPAAKTVRNARPLISK